MALHVNTMEKPNKVGATKEHTLGPVLSYRKCGPAAGLVERFATANPKVSTN